MRIAERLRVAPSGRELRPAGQRRVSGLREAIDAALDPEEPAIHVVQKDPGRVGYGSPELGRAPRALGERRGAGERLLAVGGHDRHLGRSAKRGIAQAPAMLLDEARPPPGVAAGTPWPRLDENVHPAAGGDAEQPEAQEPAQLAHARIV